jgi:hypothetical protein
VAAAAAFLRFRRRRRTTPPRTAPLRPRATTWRCHPHGAPHATARSGSSGSSGHNGKPLFFLTRATFSFVHF